MNRLEYRAFMAAAALLAGVLVAAPIWDRLYFRSVSTGPGSSIPLAAIMPEVRHLDTDAPRSASALQPRPAFSPEPIQRVMLPVGSQAGRPDSRPAPSRQPFLVRPPSLPYGGSTAVNASRPEGLAPAPNTPALSPRSAQVAHRPSAGPAPMPPANVIGGGRDQGWSQAAGWSLSPQADHGGGAPWLWTASTPQAPPLPGGTSGTPEAETSGGSPTPAPSDPQDSPRLSLVPSSTILSPGQPLVVRIILGEGGSISSVPFHLMFDPEVLQYVGAREGGIFRSTSLQPVLLASVNPSRPGDLAVGLSLIESSGLLHGSGGLLEIEFRALGQGRSDLVFDRASIRGATGEPLPVELVASSVTVR